jgi:hypothetical protein
LPSTSTTNLLAEQLTFRTDRICIASSTNSAITMKGAIEVLYLILYQKEGVGCVMLCGSFLQFFPFIYLSD